MLDKIGKKMKSEQGTSIFFGMLLFLVVSVLSVVMLDAAVTTAKNIKSDKKTEQNYLTCSSAAKLLQNEIVDVQVIKTEKRMLYIGNEEAGSMNVETGWQVRKNEEAAENLSFGIALKDAILEFQQKNPAADDILTKKYQISIPSYAVEESFDGDSFTAAAELELYPSGSGEGYDILLRVSCGEDDDVCRILVSMVGSVKKETMTVGGGSELQTVTIDTSTYTWNTKDIIYGTQERSMENVS